MRQHEATISRQAAAEIGDAVCGVIVMHRGRKMYLEPRNGRWVARTLLDDVGNDVAQEVEEWADTWQGALDHCAFVAEEVEVEDDEPGRVADAD